MKTVLQQGILYPKMHSLSVLAILIASVAAQTPPPQLVGSTKPPTLVDPIHMVHDLDEEQFEDYLDKWIEQEQSNLTVQRPSRGCSFQINKDLGQPQPVYLHNGRFLAAHGNTGQIRLSKGDEVTVACTGTDKLRSPKISNRHVATVKCQNINFVSGASWLTDRVAFGKLTCSAHPTPTVQKMVNKCFNGNSVIQVGFSVNNIFYPIYHSCFDEKRMEALYVLYSQTHEHAVHQTRVTRPTWQAENFYPGVDPTNLYKQVYQKNLFTNYFGANTAGKYITKTKQRFFARGHLAAKSDFVFATAQRSTFYYINAAPQWQCINAGNWNRLEQKLRARIGAAGYNTHIYTGTYGVLQLQNDTKNYLDIYLWQGNKVPVPLYFYKVVHDPVRKSGTAFITINNPYITPGEADAFARQFCDCHCRRRSDDFAWLNWDPDRTEIGYSFCCTVEEFRKKIPHLPAFTTTSLLV